MEVQNQNLPKMNLKKEKQNQWKQPTEEESNKSIKLNLNCNSCTEI